MGVLKNTPIFCGLNCFRAVEIIINWYKVTDYMTKLSTFVTQLIIAYLPVYNSVCDEYVAKVCSQFGRTPSFSANYGRK